MNSRNIPLKKIMYSLNAVKRIARTSGFDFELIDDNPFLWRLGFPYKNQPDNKVVIRMQWSDVDRHIPPKCTVEVGPMAYICYQEFGANFWGAETPIEGMLWALQWECEMKTPEGSRAYTAQEQEANYLHVATSHTNDWGYIANYPAAPNTTDNAKIELLRAQYYTENARNLKFAGEEAQWETLLTQRRTEFTALITQTFTRAVNILIIGLTGAGKSSFANEIFSSLLGQFQTFEETDNAANSVTNAYNQRTAFQKFRLHTLEGLDLNQGGRQTQMHFNRLTAILQGKLVKGCAMDRCTEAPAMNRDMLIDIAYIVVGPEVHASGRCMDKIIELRELMRQSRAIVHIIVNKCDVTSADDIASNGLQFQEMDPLRIIGTYDVAERMKALRATLGTSSEDMTAIICPNQASTNRRAITYFSLIILDNLLRLTRLVPGLI